MDSLQKFFWRITILSDYSSKNETLMISSTIQITPITEKWINSNKFKDAALYS